MKNTIKSISLAFVLLLGGCTSRTNSSVKNSTTIELGEFSIHNQYQDGLINNTYDQYFRYGYGGKERSTPEPVHIDFSNEFQTADQEYKVQVSTTNTFNTYYQTSCKTNSYDFYNGKLQQDYYARFSTDDHFETSNIYHFKIKDSIYRPIYLDGVTNVRDFTSWPLSNGKKLKQGVLYRGATLNTSKSDTMYLEITPSGLEEMVNHLNIKTEIDVRMNVTDNNYNENGNFTNEVIPEVTYYNIPWDYRRKDNFMTECKDVIKKVMEQLSVSTYPVYFHCSHGADRTGVTFFLLGALVGMSEEDLYKDYLLTNLGKIGGTRTEEDPKSYIEDLKALEGDTLSEQANSFLLDCGVIQETINSIKDKLLED